MNSQVKASRSNGKKKRSSGSRKIESESTASKSARAKKRKNHPNRKFQCGCAVPTRMGNERRDSVALVSGGLFFFLLSVLLCGRSFNPGTPCAPHY